MSLAVGITRSDLLTGVLGFAATIALLVAPGVEMSGVSLWFYLWPGLVASYCVPLRLSFLFVSLASIVAWFLVGYNVTAYLTEVGCSAALLLGFATWRRNLGKSDVLVLASTTLLFGVFPLFWLLKHYAEGYGLEAALLHSTRYVLNTLISIVLAEVTVMLLAFSRLDILGAIRKKLDLRPSMSSVVELIIGVAVTSSLLLTLSFIWLSWSDTLDENLQAHADMRFIMQFAGIKSVMVERGRAASLITSQYDEDRPVAEVYDLWVDTLAGRDSELGGIFERANFAVHYPSGSIRHTAGVQTAPVARGFALAMTAGDAGLVSFKLRFSDGIEYPVTVFRGPAGAAMGMLIFSGDSDAARFVLGLGLASGQTRPSSGMSLVDANASDSREHYGLSADTSVVFESPKGWLVWEPGYLRYDAPSHRSPLNNINEQSRVTLQPSPSLVERYAEVLPGLDRWRVSTSYWRFFEDYGRVVVVSTGSALAFLCLLLWFSRYLVSALVSPLSHLTGIFSSWRQLRGGELGSGAALQAMDATEFSVLTDIRGLQTGFRSLAEDVMYGERRLSKIAANYDELLRSLPLGVLAVDGASRVQFLNDAMSEITHQRQDALARLKTHAVSMLESNKTVDEWQLQWEDQPPKSLLLVVTARQDDRGKESGLWVIATDLTEQKQTNAQLVQASKLATLGEMSTGMAHELNQPLNVISLATSNLRFAIKKGKADGDNILTKLERIDGAVHRAASIIDHMRAFGRLAGEGFIEIDLGEVVRGSCDLLAEQLKLSNINLVNRVPEGGLTVKGNAIQLEQVLINQINNARDAIRENGDGGEVVVDTEVSGGRVLLRVTDTGGGIPPDVLPHIFEPFFTTKPVGKGTGLGGSISYGIVREMQGDIWAENVPGGAQITISLPLLHSQ